MPEKDCPQEVEFRDWLVGRLPVEAAETVADHLRRCTQ